MEKETKINPRNIVEIVLIVCLLIALLIALYDVLQLFFGVLMFALVFAISFESVYEWIVIKVKNNRVVAAFIYALLVIILITVPLGFLFKSITHNVKPVTEWVNNVKQNGLPPLPEAVSKTPLIGSGIVKLWSQYHDDPKQLISDHQQQVQKISQRALATGLSILQTMLEVIIGAIISALVLVRKRNINTAVRLPLDRIFGNRSSIVLLDAIAMAVRGVAIGVMGTALAAAILSFVGLRIAGVHFSGGLSAIIFFLVVIQVGPLPLWIPLIIWMSTQDHPGKVVFLIAWGIALTVVDAIIKPVLIGKSGGKLPFLVLFLGVIGGLAAWGFTGMFKGAIILAVFYTIYNSWIKNKPARTKKEEAAAIKQVDIKNNS